MTKTSKTPKTTTVHITTDTDGNLTPTSTMTINGQTVAFQVDQPGMALMQIELIRRTFADMGTRFEITATSKLVPVRAKNWLQGYTFEVAPLDPFRVEGLDMDFLLSASEFVSNAA
jgi:hypothetical protein